MIVGCAACGSDWQACYLLVRCVCSLLFVCIKVKEKIGELGVYARGLVVCVGV